MRKITLQNGKANRDYKCWLLVGCYAGRLGNHHLKFAFSATAVAVHAEPNMENNVSADTCPHATWEDFYF